MICGQMFAKIQISLPPGKQDNSNALPPGQSDRSNPRPVPRLPPPPPSLPGGLTLVGALEKTATCKSTYKHWQGRKLFIKTF